MPDCDAVLAPRVFEQNSSLYSQIAALQVISKSDYEMLKGSVGGTVFIEGLPLSGDVDAMKEELKKYMETVSFDSSVDNTNAIFSRSIDADQVAAWSDCVAASNGGVVASFVPRFDDKDSETAFLGVKFSQQIGGAQEVKVSIVIAEGGRVRGASTMKLAGTSQILFVIDRTEIVTEKVGGAITKTEKSRILKLIVSAEFPNGGKLQTNHNYFWEIPALAPYPICGIFHANRTASELGELLELHPGVSGPECRILTENLAKAGPISLNPNFRMGVSIPPDLAPSTLSLFSNGTSIAFGALNDDTKLPPEARPVPGS